MNQRNIRLELSFNGSAYRGWQSQKNALCVQNVLEKALSRAFKEDIRATGIGRTDAGAHALNYTANFKTTNHSIPVERIPLVINQRLPDDISVMGAVEVPKIFHSRFDALAREYVYLTVNGYGEKKASPFFSDRALFLTEHVDPDVVNKACRLFTGRHDFRNFCYGYGEGMDHRRRIFYFRAGEASLLGADVLVFYIKGNGFLRGMIRTMVSVCLNYAQGEVTAEMIRLALKCEKELDTKYRVPVPASGLYFKRGYYK